MKAKIYVVDLQIHTLEILEAEGDNPVDCYLNTMEDAGFDDPAVKEQAFNFYNERMKRNDEKWVIDCEDGLVFITEITE